MATHASVCSVHAPGTGSCCLPGRIIRLDPMLLNPLIANRKRRALDDGWRDEISRRNRSFGLLNEAAARRCCKNIRLCSTAGIDAVFERKERFIADVAA
jgi:hypothetical protein